MLADPQTVTIDATPYTLPRVGSKQPNRLGTFQNQDSGLELTVRQDITSNRFRREIRLTQKKVAADPISAVNKEVSASAIIVIDEPRWGFTDAELSDLHAALVARVDQSTLDQVLDGEL